MGWGGGVYLEPPAQAIGVLVDRCHLAVTLLTQLHHCVHKTLDLQLSATGEKPTLGEAFKTPSRPRCPRAGGGAPLSGQERGRLRPQGEQSGPLLPPGAPAGAYRASHLAALGAWRSQVRNCQRWSLLWFPRTLLCPCPAVTPRACLRPLPQALSPQSTQRRLDFSPKKPSSSAPPWEGQRGGHICIVGGGGGGGRPWGLSAVVHSSRLTGP